MPRINQIRANEVFPPFVKDRVIKAYMFQAAKAKIGIVSVIEEKDNLMHDTLCQCSAVHIYKLQPKWRMYFRRWPECATKGGVIRNKWPYSHIIFILIISSPVWPMNAVKFPTTADVEKRRSY